MPWGLLLAPSFIVFMGLSLLGLLSVFLSGGIFGVWFSLELMFFGFIPILNGKTVSENESTIKYFVVQSISSSILLVGFLLIIGDYSTMSYNQWWSMLGEVVVLLGFILKVGVFPMHFWFPGVMGGISWFSCFWLSVAQKIGPLWAISGLGMSSNMMNLFCFLLVATSVVGALGGFAQVQFRPLLAYSSLGQSGWMGLICLLNLKVFMFYMTIYSIILGGLICSLHMGNAYRLVEVPGWSDKITSSFWMISGGFFLSLGGLPPLLGSSLKMVGVLTIISSYPGYLFILIGCAMFSLYYYLSVFISCMVCVGVGSSSIIDGMVFSQLGALPLSLMMVLNWLGGLPAFLVCSSLVV
uniref:NADH-ubiquinone oxidoreductase chain 2 n=1 Tax=Nuttallia olivacea TaxID=1125678 RepID=I6NJQ3_9BIVA|nr:NADH dehydrogenase subunit 2 [Nuttallia olivacea]AEV94302.1 NADH dehydrogenase subunit 2 [Nuttallia olivacea]